MCGSPAPEWATHDDARLAGRAARRSHAGPTLRQADLVKALCGRAGLTRQDANEMVEEFFGIVRDTLAAGEAVKLSGFGSFRLRDKPPRSGRNPQTGVATLIEARRVVTFHPGPTFRAGLGRR